MSVEMAFVFALIAIAAMLFASNLVRLDVVAILVVLALMLSGVLSPAEAVSGFGSSIVILVACLLVVGEMLVRTGIAHRISDWIARVGGEGETRLTALIMAAAALLSGVMSSTAVVAIFIPVVVNIAAKRGLKPSRMLMPLSFAALIGGTLTLIATPPNLIVSSELEETGLVPFRFFSFAAIGLVILAAGIVYMLVVGRRLIGADTEPAASTANRTIDQLVEDFDLDQRLHIIQIPAQSPLAGQTVREAGLEARYGVRVLASEEATRGRRGELSAVSPAWKIPVDHDIIVIATDVDVHTLVELERVRSRIMPERERDRLVRELGVAVVLIHPESQLVGEKLHGGELWSRHGVHVIGIRRARKAVADLAGLSLFSGDALLVVGAWDRLAQLQAARHDFVVLNFPAEMKDVAPERRRAPVAIAILAGMVLLSLFQVVPILTAVMMAAFAAVATRCLTMDDAYRSIHWSSIVLLAGMLPLADALGKTGGIELIVSSLVSGLGDSGPYALLSLLFWGTALLGLFLSNTATSVVMAPIGIQAAQALGISPYPLAVAIVIAASAGFASPVSSPVVTLVVEPGRYRFIDFVKVGFPLMLLVYLIALVMIPLLFPFDG